LIERYSNPGAVVLDPTAGSFNSIEAAQQLGRTAIGMEMNDEFFAAAQAKFGIEVRNEIISPPPEDAV
jgi:DNA modification methylase